MAALTSQRVISSCFTALLIAFAALGCSDDSGDVGGSGGSGNNSATGGSGGTNTGGTGATASGGSSAAGGSSGSGGSAPATGGSAGMGTGGAGGGAGETGEYCRPNFTSGVNVAWFNFGNDIPNPPIDRFEQLFDTIVPVGGKVVRWWLHTDGRRTPAYDASGFAEPIPETQVEDLRRILDAAEASGVMMVVSIWGFDMLQNHHGNATIMANNKLLLTSDEHRQAYIDNVLTPLVSGLKGHRGLYAWEIFNEPEGMTEEHGWSEERITMPMVQKNVNWMAAAIRAADPEALVTNAAWTFISSSNAGSYTNAYSDAALLAAGGKPEGTLDFYEVHYYDNWGGQDNRVVSPFAHPVSHWNLDKPVVIGEFWPLDVVYSGDYKADDMYTILYENGYSGAWAWQYANIDGSDAQGYSDGGKVDARWPAMQQSMQNLMDVAGSDLDCQ